MNKLKRAVIKQEFVELCGNYIEAVILNQFQYWTEFIKDVDDYISEESARLNKPDSEIQLNYGWIYKSYEQLNSATMLNLSRPTLSKYVKHLIELDFIQVKDSGEQCWNKAYQYRFNLIKVAQELANIGYNLDGYSLPDTLSKILQHDVKNFTASGKNFYYYNNIYNNINNNLSKDKLDTPKKEYPEPKNNSTILGKKSLLIKDENINLKDFVTTSAKQSKKSNVDIKETKKEKFINKALEIVVSQLKLTQEQIPIIKDWLLMCYEQKGLTTKDIRFKYAIQSLQTAIQSYSWKQVEELLQQAIIRAHITLQYVIQDLNKKQYNKSNTDIYKYPGKQDNESVEEYINKKQDTDYLSTARKAQKTGKGEWV